MRNFVLGMLAMTTVVAALVFLRYWRASGDRLFAFFALAFVAMSVSWTALAATPATFDEIHYVYLVRLLAFVLIIVGIIDKNRRAGPL